jgi:hypothetical protein
MAGAFDTVRQMLDTYGLGGLAEWAWGRFQEGASLDMIMTEVYQRPEFRAVYPEYEVLAQRGRAVSVDYLASYRKAVVEIFRSYGIPETFYDSPEDLSRFAANEVSVAEISKRVAQASRAVYTSPPEVRQELERMYNVRPGDLVAFWLDPDRTVPIMEQQFLAAEVGAQARTTGFGMLTREESERLAGMGVTAEAAQRGFAALGQAQELFNPLSTSEEEISQDVQLGAVFGQNVEAQRQVEQRRQQRQAEFAGGGQYAMTREGMVGLTGE